MIETRLLSYEAIQGGRVAHSESSTPPTQSLGNGLQGRVTRGFSSRAASLVCNAVRHVFGVLCALVIVGLTLIGLIHLGNWVYKKLFRAAHIIYKQEIKNKIIADLKKAVTDSGILNDPNPEVKSLVKKIQEASNNSTSMKQINEITDQVGKLSSQVLDQDKPQRNDPTFKFLKLCAAARMIPDGSEATKKYGGKKLKGEKIENVGQLADKWRDSTNSVTRIHRDWWLPTFFWGILNWKKACQALNSRKDCEEKISYDALEDNVGVIAYKVNGIRFLHTPTPSAPNNTPVFRMYLKHLKDTDQKHIHFQYQSTHKSSDMARIRQIQTIAEQSAGVFQQVIFNFDALKKEKPPGLEKYKTDQNHEEFFDSLKTWIKSGIRTVDTDHPVTIPTNLLNDAQIDKAFEVAKSICLLQKNDEPPEEYAEVVLKVIYGVLMTAIVQTRQEVEKDKLIISGGCMQCADRGSVMNAILMLFSESSQKSEHPIDQRIIEQAPLLYATMQGRAQVANARMILKDRMEEGEWVIRHFERNKEKIPRLITQGMNDIRSQSHSGAEQPS